MNPAEVKTSYIVRMNREETLDTESLENALQVAETLKRLNPKADVVVRRATWGKLTERTMGRRPLAVVPTVQN